jgi:hypothetical protein
VLIEDKLDDVDPIAAYYETTVAVTSGTVTIWARSCAEYWFGHCCVLFSTGFLKHVDGLGINNVLKMGCNRRLAGRQWVSAVVFRKDN